MALQSTEETVRSSWDYWSGCLRVHETDPPYRRTSCRWRSGGTDLPAHLDSRIHQGGAVHTMTSSRSGQLWGGRARTRTLGMVSPDVHWKAMPKIKCIRRILGYVLEQRADLQNESNRTAIIAAAVDGLAVRPSASAEDDLQLVCETSEIKLPLK